ncbi:hypothetical protein LPJ66_007907, partial [Kickxella alabastrina]
MILLEPNSYVLEETLYTRFTSEKPEVVDITLVDFDNVIYRVQTSATERNLLNLSVEMKYFAE